MSEPKFTGVWIPASVFQTMTVSTTAKVVYGVIDALDNDDGCFASNAYLSKHLGLKERQLRNILKELDDARLIVRIEQDGRRVIRTVEKVAVVNALADSHVTRSEGGAAINCHGGRQNIAMGGGNKLPPYNKEDNKEDKDTKSRIPFTVPLPFETDAFADAWTRWIDYRKEMKKPLKPKTVEAQWAQFKVWGESDSINAIDTSIANGWVGLFRPRTSNGSNKTLTEKDHHEF